MIEQNDIARCDPTPYRPRHEPQFLSFDLFDSVDPENRAVVHDLVRDLQRRPVFGDDLLANSRRDFLGSRD